MPSSPAVQQSAFLRKDSAEEYDLSQIDDDDEELQELFREVSEGWLVARWYEMPGGHPVKLWKEVL